MKLAKLRYKGHSWLHNPKSLKIEKEQILTENIIPSCGTHFQNIGEKPRVVTGQGQLYGKDCLFQYNRLVNLRNQQGSGILTLPDIKPFYAFFRTIELVCEPSPDMVSYKFEFVEDLSARKSETSEFYHRVSEGETLWDIAYRYDVDIDRLVQLNPWIKRIDELEAEKKVRVC